MINISISISVGSGAPDLNELRDALREIYKRQGHIVVGTNPDSGRYSIGQEIDELYGLRLGGRFAVRRYASEAAYRRQNKLLMKLKPDWPWSDAMQDYPRGANYYLVTPVHIFPRAQPGTRKLLPAKGRHKAA